MPFAVPASWFDRLSTTCYRPHAMRATSSIHLVAGALTAMVCLGACGADVELDVTRSDNRKAIRGVVELPNGQLAKEPGSPWQQFAAILAAPARALTGNAEPAAGVRVELVRLAAADAAAGQPGELLDAETTLNDGTFTILLPRDTDANTCRFLIQVGDADEGTLTRALVHNNTGPIRVDFRSEAAVRLILEEVPPADFCSFDTAEIAAIVAAVDAAPGLVNENDVESANDLATIAAAGDTAVQNAIAAAMR